MSIAVAFAFWVSRAVSIATFAVISLAVISIAEGIRGGEGGNWFRKNADCLGLRGDGGESRRTKGVDIDNLVIEAGAKTIYH